MFDAIMMGAEEGEEVEVRVNEKEEIDEEGEEEEKDIARYGSVRSMQCSAVQSGVARLLVQFLEALVVLYYLCTLRYVIDDAYVTSDLSVDFGTRRSDSVVSLRDLCIRNSAC